MVTPATAVAATIAYAAFFSRCFALGFANRRFAAGSFLVAMVTIAEQPAAAAATAASAKQAGIGRRLQAHDDDTHRRQT